MATFEFTPRLPWTNWAAVAGLGGFLTCFVRQGVARFGAAAAFLLLSAVATTANAKEPLGHAPAEGLGVDPDVTGAALQVRGTSLPKQMTQACDRGPPLREADRDQSARPEMLVIETSRVVRVKCL